MNLALFDFDGTITHCDTFTPFMKEVIPSSRLFWGRLLLLPTLLGYRAGIFSASRVRQQVVRIGLKGFTKVDIHAQGKRYASQRLPTLLRPNALKRLKWHQDGGDRVIIVSASLDVYLKPWCEEMGIELICSELDFQDSLLTGEYRGEDCTGQEKAKRVLEKVNLSDYLKIYAYGDTKEDHELLELAHEKYYQWIKL